MLDSHRAYLSGGPNFAYEPCVRKVADPSGLDLRSVRVLTNGAEPVRPGTLRRFTEALAGSGLAPDADSAELSVGRVRVVDGAETGVEQARDSVAELWRHPTGRSRPP